MSARNRQIEAEIAQHRAAIAELEEQLGIPDVDVAERPWPPPGFYFTFYVVVGAILGVLGSLTSFLFNVFGSLVIDQDPYRVLRVFGTVFLGQEALTTDNLNFFMLVAVVHFSVGALAGAVYHVAVNYFFPGKSWGWHLAAGAAYGVLMWIVNFYLVLTWLEPALVGQAFVLEYMPAWVAALTHIVFGVTVGALQPLGHFTPFQPVEARAR